MKAGFYTPYLDSLGGGERYMLSLVQMLNELEWKTVLFWSGETVNERVRDKFGINIDGAEYESGFNFRTDPMTFFSTKKYWQSYDLLFFVSDGSLPWMWGKRNIVHFQVPFRGVNGKSLLNTVKKRLINNFVVNSEFTKQFIDDEYGVDSKVIYPPVAVDEFAPLPKKKAILNVARFSNLLQQKGHLVAIDAFKKLCDTGVSDYELWLAGSTEVGDGGLLDSLKMEAEGYPVRFYVNLGWNKLKNLFREAKFFWSAAGMKANELTEPEKCEHFGIALVEAMASGCVPIVINKGGYREIVFDGESGLLWNTEEQLMNLTTRLMSDESHVAVLSSAAIKRAGDFSKQRFEADWQRLIG